MQAGNKSPWGIVWPLDPRLSSSYPVRAAEGGEGEGVGERIQCKNRRAAQRHGGRRPGPASCAGMQASRSPGGGGGFEINDDMSGQVGE